jgi:hypothetical protein
MTSENRKSFLELRIIWKDDEMFELNVTASNIDFFGTTQVYDQSESILRFASTLVDFPKGDTTLFHEAGEKDSYAYFSMRYYPIGRTGRVGVEVSLESNVATEFRPEEKNKLKLEIIVEPSAIDNFQKELVTLARTEEGCAILYGSGFGKNA